ncbi:MAG: glycosyltransferase family 4 protein [Thermoleophilia bacterium]
MSGLIFWQNVPSIHQAPLIRAVARSWPHEVLVVTEWDLAEDRLSQGWERPDFSPARLIVAPSPTARQALIAQYGFGDPVHIFSGLHAYPETYRTLKQVSRTGTTIGVFAEPGRSDDGLRALGRRLQYRLEGLRWGRRLDFLLATGESGIRWYAQAGFPRERLFPFGYFVERGTGEVSDEAMRDQHGDVNRAVRLLFVGQLVPWKGVDLLLHALSGLNHLAWGLEVVGSGSQSENYETLASNLGLSERVTWMGPQSNRTVRQLMGDSDVLVLPSRYDGWGAVVNEALSAGIPVIVSEACGASDLVRAPLQGEVFRAGSVRMLRGALASVMGRGRLRDSERARIRDWALATIAPEVAARYLTDVIQFVQGNGEKPGVPWRVGPTVREQLSSTRCKE